MLNIIYVLLTTAVFWSIMIRLCNPYAEYKAHIQQFLTNKRTMVLSKIAYDDPATIFVYKSQAQDNFFFRLGIQSFTTLFSSSNTKLTGI